MNAIKKAFEKLSAPFARNHTLRRKIVASQAAFAMVPLLLLAILLAVTLNENELRGKKESISYSLRI